MATPANALKQPSKAKNTNEGIEDTVDLKDGNFGNADFIGEIQSGAAPKDSGDKIRNDSKLAK